jgi:YD repeat-containing protein
VGGPTYTGTFGYDGNSKLTSIGLPGGTGVSAGLGYDASSRLHQLDLTGPAGVANALNSHYTYSYDGLNRTSGITAIVNGVSTPFAPTYDALGRMLTDGTGWTFTMQDLDGNLHQAIKTGTTQTYAYATSGQPNELTSFAQTSQATQYVQYDANGTHTVGTQSVGNSGGYPTIISTNSNFAADCPTGSIDASSTCLSYDAQGRLQRAAMKNGNVATITYNTAGQRASYTVVNGATTQLSEIFTYRNGELAQVASSGATIGTPYTDTFIYRQDGAPYELLRQTTGTTSHYWYILNGHGDVVARRDPHFLWGHRVSNVPGSYVVIRAAPMQTGVRTTKTSNDRPAPSLRSERSAITPSTPSASMYAL